MRIRDLICTILAALHYGSEFSVQLASVFSSATLSMATNIDFHPIQPSWALTIGTTGHSLKRWMWRR